MFLRKRQFYEFIKNYQPAQFEEFNETDYRFDLRKRYVNYALKNRFRFYVTLKFALRYFSATPLTVLDLGTYPGTLLRILHELLPRHPLSLYGVGLKVPPDFIQAMKEKAQAVIMAVNLDPKNEQLKNKGYPLRIPLKDESVDFVFSLEIIEHLSSPFHLLSEAKRVLKKGGKLILTTPNIARIGSIMKLLIGRSNLDRIPFNYYDEDDEWRPHQREYSMKELTDIVTAAGFRILEKRFINTTERRFDAADPWQKAIEFLKTPFYCMPHYRETLLLVAQRLGDDYSC